MILLIKRKGEIKMALSTNIVCPLCGLNRPLKKKGTNALMQGKAITSIKGLIRFDKVNPVNGIFEDIREAGGRGSGFYRTKKRSLKEIVESNDYNDLVSQIKNQCIQILQIINSTTDKT